jgi:hypothetical protein
LDETLLILLRLVVEADKEMVRNLGGVRVLFFSEENVNSVED